MSPRLEVAVGVVVRADGRVLLGQRVDGKPYAGWWEFPGGKLEAGETVAQALARELHEELGLAVTTSHPWLVREFVYPHAHVRLHFRRLFTEWGDVAGEPQSREGQAFTWQAVDEPVVAPLLPASEPVFGWLRWPRRLIDANAPTPAQPAWRCLANDPSGAVSEERIDAARARAHAEGARLLISSAIGVDRLAADDGLLLEAADLSALTARPAVGWCVARCRDANDLARAEALGVDAAISGRVDGQSGLPVYLAEVDLDLRQAIALGAHGLAVLPPAG